ncbi:basic leucine zipper 61-like [Aristolochia californica]|uniref:basic leucine zipper 61-like n=1 Tax=Aristolochia californica TaxID=171875 RepID=UPI0035DC6DF5
MAQLPPKIPTMSSNWPALPHQRPVTLLPTTNTASSLPSWVDEFLDFSSAKRGAHRRSASDSIAFLEAPLLDECRTSSAALKPECNNVFDRLDDEQLMSMFSDDISTTVPANVSNSNSSTPSDHNSINDDKPTLSDQQQRNEPEVQSSCKVETPIHAPSFTTSGDPIIDPKRVKRILANRQSAQRSRVRKLQYISELERSVTSLQTEVSALSPRVAFLDHQRLVLNVDNSALKQRIAALAQDKIFKDAHQEALKHEIERLRQVYHQQNLKRMGGNSQQQQQQQQQHSEQSQLCTDKELLS